MELFWREIDYKWILFIIISGLVEGDVITALMFYGAESVFHMALFIDNNDVFDLAVQPFYLLNDPEKNQFKLYSKDGDWSLGIIHPGKLLPNTLIEVKIIVTATSYKVSLNGLEMPDFPHATSPSLVTDFYLVDDSDITVLYSLSLNATDSKFYQCIHHLSKSDLISAVLKWRYLQDYVTYFQK